MPAICGGWVRGWHSAVAVADQFLAQRAFAVGGFEQTAVLEFGNQEVGNVDERAGGEGAADIETVDIGLLGPGSELVGNLRGSTNDGRPAAKMEVFGD